MCGICGYIARKEYNERVLKDMNDTMYHRGPDDSGLFQRKLYDGYYIGMAHRRLSILDLSELGHQPMFNQDKTICIVYNGEVYNFIEIREELKKKDFYLNLILIQKLYWRHMNFTE